MPAVAGAAPPPSPPRCSARRGRLTLAGDMDTALAAYARALDLGLDEALQPLAQAPLSLAHKRRGAWPSGAGPVGGNAGIGRSTFRNLGAS